MWWDWSIEWGGRETLWHQTRRKEAGSKGEAWGKEGME